MVLGLQHLGELGERLDSLNETMRSLDEHLVEMSTSFESVAHSLEKLTSTLGYLDTPLKIATAPLEPVHACVTGKAALQSRSGSGLHKVPDGSRVVDVLLPPPPAIRFQSPAQTRKSIRPVSEHPVHSRIRGT